MTRSAAPASLPAGAYAAGGAGPYQIMVGAEEHVAAGEHLPAVLDRRQIELILQSTFAMPLRHHLAVHPQPRHAAVRINVKTQMREGVGGVDGEIVLGVPF